MEDRIKEHEFSFKSLFVPFTTLKAIHWIILVGLVVYFNSLFNGFVGDDSFLILLNPDIHSVVNIPTLFAHGNFHDDSHQINNFYRPVLSTVFNLEYSVFGTNPLGYHSISVLLHIVNAILIFLVFMYFFKREFAFILALLFLVHPINTETVANISAQQEILFLFFGLIAFYIAINKQEKTYSIYLIPLLLLFSMLSKETGAVFLLLIPLFNLLTKKKMLIKSAIQSLLVFLIYIFLRLEVARLPFGSGLKIVPIQTLSLSERVINIPLIIFTYLKTFVYPKDLIVLQSWIIKRIDIQHFYFPLFIDTIFSLCLIIFGVFLFYKKKKFVVTYILFFTWFVVSLSLHLQLLPLDETVSYRWFYLPIIGILGIFGVVFSLVKYQVFLRILLPFVFFVMLLLSIRVIDRNSNWQSEQTLASHDILQDRNNFQLERLLGNSYYQLGEINNSEIHFIRSTQLFPSEITFTGLGNFYLRINQPKKAEAAFEKSLSYSPLLADTWVYLATAKYYAGDKAGALSAIKKANAIAPNNLFIQIQKAMEMNLQYQLN